MQEANFFSRGSHRSDVSSAEDHQQISHFNYMPRKWLFLCYYVIQCTAFLQPIRNNWECAKLTLILCLKKPCHLIRAEALFRTDSAFSRQNVMLSHPGRHSTETKYSHKSYVAKASFRCWEMHSNVSIATWQIRLDLFLFMKLWFNDKWFFEAPAPRKSYTISIAGQVHTYLILQ